MKSRRSFIMSAVTGVAALGIRNLGYTGKEDNGRILCIGAHPDDPESGCGGTLALLSKSGWKVTVLYLTAGERGIKGLSYREAGAIRKKEGIAACSILNVKPVFAGQVNGEIVFDNFWISRMTDLIDSEKPDIVFSHWPIDTHEDHQVAAILTIQAWRRTHNPFLLYFYEVCAGEQSLMFYPTDYVDISETLEQKRKAVYCHQSQDPASIYECGHTLMEEFRGKESGGKAAEAFIRMTDKKYGIIPSLKK